MISITKLARELKKYFLSKSGNNTISGDIYVDTASAYNLGTADRPFKAIYADSLVGTPGDSGGTTVKVSVNDTAAGYLNTKVIAVFPIAKEIVSTFGDERLHISLMPNTVLMADGSVGLYNNLSVLESITIDGVDISKMGGNTVLGGAGLRSSGDLLKDGSPTLWVGAGHAISVLEDAIAVNADSLVGAGLVAVNSKTLGINLAYNFAWSGTHAFSNTTTFNQRATFNSTPYISSHLMFTGATARAITSTTGVAINISPSDVLRLNPGNSSTSYIVLDKTRTMNTVNYVSKTTGWEIDYAGNADFRYLYADEMHVKSFIADLETALAGGQIITKSVTSLASNFSVPAYDAYRLLHVNDLPSAKGIECFEVGDWIALRIFSRSYTVGPSNNKIPGPLQVAWCFGTIARPYDAVIVNGVVVRGAGVTDNRDGTQTWAFRRANSANGGMATATTVVYADSIVLDFGVSGSAFYETTAADGKAGSPQAYSPYSQIVKWTGNPNSRDILLRMGNLKGLNLAETETYGLYVKGSNSGYLLAQAEGIWLKNATLEMSMLDGGTWMTRTQLSYNGNVKFGLNIAAPTTTSFFHSGATQTYNSESLVAGDIIIGNPSGANMKWSKASGTLSFRGNKTIHSYLNSSGQFVTGGGNVVLDGGGLSILSDTQSSVTRSHAITWKSSTTSEATNAMLYNTVYTNVINLNVVSLLAKSTGRAGYIELAAYNGNGLLSTGVVMQSQFTESSLAEVRVRVENVTKMAVNPSGVDFLNSNIKNIHTMSFTPDSSTTLPVPAAGQSLLYVGADNVMWLIPSGNYVKQALNSWGIGSSTENVAHDTWIRLIYSPTFVPTGLLIVRTPSNQSAMFMIGGEGEEKIAFANTAQRFDIEYSPTGHTGWLCVKQKLNVPKSIIWRWYGMPYR